MTQANILELAKQGDVKAIASLMNSQLQLKNVTVKVTLKNGCLRVILESTQVPDQQNLVKYVRQEIMGLRSETIKKVKVDGFQQGKNFAVWSQELNLELQQALTASLNKQSSNIEIKKFIFKQQILSFAKKLTGKQYIAIAIVLIGIYIVGKNQIFQRQGCIIQSYLQGKSTEGCK
ncbi:hypothetical protein [Fischerella sp. PCC 9605]|uniref:hypothetical protein n=1 Tax=Fischerella sp. PCC 9605 TaxID=1173024 RepID=UPI0004797282|nr:hypothetical protein [Fischerella sp. PCC 9605]